jgi:hypothetical protein
MGRMARSAVLNSDVRSSAHSKPMHVGKALPNVLIPFPWDWAGPAYRYHGCFDDRNGPYQGNDKRTLPQVHNDLHGGISLDECAAAARSKGFPYFALQGYGVCFFGSAADVARLQATQRLSDDNCSSVPCPTGAATCSGNINKVYFITRCAWPLPTCANQDANLLMLPSQLTLIGC